jgi:hypothetical protein
LRQAPAAASSRSTDWRSGRALMQCSAFLLRDCLHISSCGSVAPHNGIAITLNAVWDCRSRCASCWIGAASS